MRIRNNLNPILLGTPDFEHPVLGHKGRLCHREWLAQTQPAATLSNGGTGDFARRSKRH